MKPFRFNLLLCICFFTFSSLMLTALQAAAAPVDAIDSKARCPVCGMFVAKYPDWITQIHHKDGTIKNFDGVKDMMAYYLDPGQFGGSPRETMQEIWVKDYYTLAWLDGRQAFYVYGSEIYGPMGHELIPFSSKDAAAAFLQDHHGKQILSFEEITKSLVESMRSGHKMKP